MAHWVWTDEISLKLYYKTFFFGANSQVNLQMTPNCWERSNPWRAGLLLRGTGTGWRNALQEPWSLGQASTKSYTWVGITPHNRTGWELAVQERALLKRTWGCWWMTAICHCCKVSYIQDCISKRLASRARDSSSSFVTCETIPRV